MCKDAIPELLKIFERTKKNCHFYQERGQEVDLFGEIHALRGVAYALEAVGIDPWNDDDVAYYCNVMNDLDDEISVALKERTTRVHHYVGNNPT